MTNMTYILPRLYSPVVPRRSVAEQPSRASSYNKSQRSMLGGGESSYPAWAWAWDWAWARLDNLNHSYANR